MNYNADSALFANHHFKTLRVIAGHIVTATGETVARCTDDAHAMSILASAGYTGSGDTFQASLTN